MGVRWIPLAFALTAPPLLACAPAEHPASIAHPLLAQPLPAFRRGTLGGAVFDSAQAAGKVVLVKFFADYCEPCKATLPAAERVHRKHPDVVFVGVDEDETAASAGTLVERYALSFPIIHDDGNVLSGRFRVTAMPMTFVADRAGVIRWVGGEGQTEDDMVGAVEQWR